jgi:hypothetical protein
LSPRVSKSSPPARLGIEHHEILYPNEVPPHVSRLHDNRRCPRFGRRLNGRARSAGRKENPSTTGIEAQRTDDHTHQWRAA